MTVGIYEEVNTLNSKEKEGLNRFVNFLRTGKHLMCNKMKEKFNSIILLYLSEIYTIVDLNLYVCPVKNTDTLILSVKLKDMFPIQPSGGTPIKYLYYD